MATVPLAVRVRNTRYDGMITGYLHGGVKFTKTDPGGFRSASFTVDQRLGFRDDMIQPYSRIYIYDRRNGRTVFEGDISHPGRSMNSDGSLLDVQVEGGVERLRDWSGQRIYIDRDLAGWVQTANNTNGALADVGEDRGGSGADALTLSFPNSFHVELNYRSEVAYYRLSDAGQDLGWFNYAWDGGHNSGSPGWLVRGITSSPSTVVRSQVLSLAGSSGSGAVVGTTFAVGTSVPFIQLIWTVSQVGGSNVGTADIVWASLMRVIVQCRYRLQDGVNFLASANYDDYTTAVKVVGDILGAIVGATFDGPNARIDTGLGYQIRQLAYPDGVNALQILDDLMGFENGCTYIVGPSKPGVDKYSFAWMARSNVPRYEFLTWMDEYSAGPQAVDQYNEVVTKWKSPNGLMRSTTSTQPIPEMVAMGRTRRYFQDLSDSVSDVDNATQANSAVLVDHRFPQNGGSITIGRPVVDLWTGRRVQPYEIEPGYICRIAGVNPSRDALNSSPRNGNTLCRIVTTNYDSDSHSVSIDLDSEPWSMARAIAKAKPTPTSPQRKAF